jgi:FkbM family methyltransferase
MSMPLRLILRLIALAPHRLDAWYPGWAGRRHWLRAREAALSFYPVRFAIQIEPEGARYTGSTKDVIQRAVYVYGVWEPDITEWMRTFVRPGDTVVDVGANTGYYSLLCSALVGESGRVLAFEPVPSLFREFQANLHANAGSVVEPRQVALGSQRGEIDVYRADEANVGNSSTRWEPGHKPEGKASLEVGDELLQQHAARIRLIKIDTEGDEIEILRGLRRTLDYMPPGSAVLVEVTPEKLRLRDQHPDEVWEMFAKLGWQANSIRNDYDFSRYDRPVHGGDRLRPLGSPPVNRADLVFLKPSAEATQNTVSRM